MAITFINSTQLVIGTAASTWSFLLNTPACTSHGGAAFVVGIGPMDTTVTVSSVGDDLGNQYTFITRVGSSKSAHAELWYRPNISSASTRLHIGLSGNSSGSMAAAHFDGISTANAVLDSTNGANTALSTVHNLPELTPSEANAAVIGFYRMHDDTSQPRTADDSFLFWTDSAAAVREFGLYKIFGAASTATMQMRTGAAATSTGQVFNAGVMAVFSDTFTGGAPAAVLFPGGFTLMGIQ